MLLPDIKCERCPFCGGKAGVHKYLSKYYASCKKCKSYSAPYDTPEEAVAAWNCRVVHIAVPKKQYRKINRWSLHK